jgi:hypothetical protein
MTTMPATPQYRRRLTKSLQRSLLLTLLSLAVIRSSAQAPSNNLCANAIMITCNSAVNGTTIASTNTGAPGTCVTSLNTAGGVWYKVVGWNGDMTVSLCNSSYDTKIGVFTGNCGSFSCVKGNDDDMGLGGAGVCGGGLASSTSWTATAGVIYHIYVTGFSSGTGNFELVVTCGDSNFPCPANGLTLEFQTDANASEVSWEIIPDGLTMFACRGSGLPDNAVITTNCCLPNGCYRLEVMDSAGDGMVNGGYILRTEGSNQRIIDNRNNFLSGSLSAISGLQGFCLPIGTNRLIYTSCDKLDWVNNQFLVASPDPAVSALWVEGGSNSMQSATTGYEFWFFDPNGTYSFRRFRSHNQPDGFGNVGATRTCHMQINNWGPANHIPAFVLVNVRVRSRIEGVNSEWGPACRFKIDPVAAECPLTKLMDIPGSATLSCGEYRNWGSGNFVHARPVSGATQYQFRFRQPAEGYQVVRNATSYFTQLFWTVPPPLVAGSQYEVDVRAFRNGQWCPWGDVCTLNINPAMMGQLMSSRIEEPAVFTLWPNPNAGDRFSIRLDAIPEEVSTVNVDIFDLYGRRIVARQLPVNEGSFTASLDMDPAPAAGIYVVTVTAGEHVHSQRMVIHR